MKIENIVFDFGGVLVDWNPRYLYNDFFEDKQEMEYFLENICNSDWNELQDAGRPLDIATKKLQNEFPEYKEMIGRYYDDWEVMLKDEISENTRLLKPLKEKKYRLFGLSNWSAETFPLAFKRFPFFKEFEGIILSGEEKMIKPYKDIYHLLVNRYNIKAENSLFIDDNHKNILVADELGFHTIHFKGGVNLENELKRMQIL